MKRGSKGTQGVRRSARKSTLHGQPSIYSTPRSASTKVTTSGSEDEQTFGFSPEGVVLEVPDHNNRNPEDSPHIESEESGSDGSVLGSMAPSTRLKYGRFRGD